MAAIAVDGRVLRGERNRRALVDATLALVADGEPRPGAARIAGRAGVAARSVFHHFADLEALYAAVADRQMERVLPMVTAIAPGPVAERADALARQRAGIFEFIAPVRRAALIHRAASPAVAERLDLATRRLRAQTAATFAPELGAEQRRDDLLVALDAAAGWEAWDALRTVHRRSAATAERVVARTLTALARGGTS